MPLTIGQRVVAAGALTELPVATTWVHKGNTRWLQVAPAVPTVVVIGAAVQISRQEYLSPVYGAGYIEVSHVERGNESWEYRTHTGSATYKDVGMGTWYLMEEDPSGPVLGP